MIPMFSVCDVPTINMAKRRDSPVCRWILYEPNRQGMEAAIDTGSFVCDSRTLNMAVNRSWMDTVSGEIIRGLRLPLFLIDTSPVLRKKIQGTCYSILFCVFSCPDLADTVFARDRFYHSPDKSIL